MVYDAKISEIENKYITTTDYNKNTKDIATNKIKSERLVNKSTISGFVNNVDLDKNGGSISNKSWIKSRER